MVGIPLNCLKTANEIFFTIDNDSFRPLVFSCFSSFKCVYKRCTICSNAVYNWIEVFIQGGGFPKRLPPWLHSSIFIILEHFVIQRYNIINHSVGMNENTFSFIPPSLIIIANLTLKGCVCSKALFTDRSIIKPWFYYMSE